MSHRASQPLIASEKPHGARHMQASRSLNKGRKGLSSLLSRIESQFIPRIYPVYGLSRQFSHHLLASPATARLKTASEVIEHASAIDLHKWAPSWTSPPLKWVVFSDLHVTPRTLPVCLDVLRRVRDEAAARNAGIAFLGDFWHFRGSLPVEPLNTLISLFANEWQVKTLMLAGNHDQVTLGGLTHGLTPLAAAASDTVHVCDGPALYAGALWLPYRRNPAEIEDAINAAMALNPPKAIFAHVDVQGASLNSLAQARDGFCPSLFPQGVPVYTGHYHKPHIVPGTQIRYVGSPYQISRSEAGQTKALLVLDENWHVCEEIVLDLGPRHFDVVASSVEGQELVDVLPSELRRGDKVRVTLPSEHVKQQNKLLKKLSSKGIGIEVVTVAAPSAAPRIAAAEDLGPFELFEKYAEMKGMQAGAINRGLEILRAVDASATAHHHRQVSLSFSSVEVEGYFSFVEPQTYELKDRGLVVVTGQLESTAGAASQPVDGSTESNGAGKTALVMAPLWALTGDVDARSELGAGRGLTNADVVNEDCKHARVKVQGTVDGVPFVVERKVVRRGRGGYLTFELNGTDRTTQDIRLTQAEIDAVLGTTLLGRSAFYGQSEITALLESSDKAFKEELAKIVDLAVWAEAKEASRGALAEVRGKVGALGTEIQVKQGYVEQQKAETAVLEAQRAVYMDEMEERKMQNKQKVDAAMVALQRSTEELRKLVEEGEKVLMVTDETNNREEMEERGEEEQSELAARERQLLEAQEALAAAQLRRGAAHATANTKQTQLQNYSNLHDHDHDGSNDDVVCDRCLQSVSPDQRASTTATLEAELESALKIVDEADRDAAAAADRVTELAAAVQAERHKQMEMLQAQAAARAEAAQIRSSLERGVKESRHLLMEAEEILIINENGGARSIPEEAAALVLDENLLVEALRQAYQHCRDHLSAASSAAADLAACDAELNPLDAEISRKQEWLEKESKALEEAEKQFNELNTHLDQLKAVDDAFRPTGIVSFVLEGALGALQQSSNHNLATLAPGMALELSASRPRATSNSETAASTIEQVEKKVLIRLPGSNELRQRSVRQLSGGERRRVALALALGFTDLAARRGRLRCDFLVLDEVMQHLDGEGCARLAGLLRGLDEFGTVLVVAQAKSFMTRAFDGVDVVVKGEKGSMIM